MPPKKKTNKPVDPVTRIVKRTRRVTKNILSGKKLEISVINQNAKTNNTACKDVNDERNSNKQEQKNVQLSKRDINIMLANEVLKIKFPSKISSVRALEANTTISREKEQINQPKKENKGLKIKFPGKISSVRAIKANMTVSRAKEQINQPKKENKSKLINSNKKITTKKEIVKKNKDVAQKTANKRKQSVGKASNNNQERSTTNSVVQENTTRLQKKPAIKLKRNKKVGLQEAENNKLIENKARPKSKPAVAVKKKILPEPNKKIVRRGRKKLNNTDDSNNLKNDVALLKTEVPSEEKGVKSLSPISYANKNITINLRRTSCCSDLSWTRDISSCSTTSFLTVSSKDFVRIDNKLPILKLTNINTTCAKENISEPISEKNKPAIHETLHQLSLSSSSSSSSSGSSVSESGNTSCLDNKIKNDDYVSKLSANLKRIDLEVIIWIGYTNNNSDSMVKLDSIKEHIFKSDVLREEKKLLQQYQTIRRLLSKYKKTTDSNISLENVDKEKPIEDVQFNQPNNYINQTKHVYPTEKPLQKKCSEPLPTESTLSHSTVNNIGSKCPEENYDDDTLSLYAESLTGLDSSKRNSSIQRARDSLSAEEYIPEFITKTSNKPETLYHPTKIISLAGLKEAETLQDEFQNNVVANICEKQNADSTSVNKDQEIEKNAPKNIIYEDRRGSSGENNIVRANVYNIARTPLQSTVRLVAANFKPTRGTQSAVYKQVCTFNLMSYCKVPNCKFPHAVPSIDEVKRRVSMLNEEAFVTEYMLTRSVPNLRQIFGLCFVNECVKRNLTRLLVEMAIDFITKVDVTDKKDNDVKTEVVEITLLYLNNVDLNVCHDMLLYKLVKPNLILLCDYLLKFIAESPNFTRFIPIFLKLTWYISSMGYIFDIETSTLLLERVCILPYDNKLARALIEVIKRTNDSIYSNFMIEKFENLLISSNKDLYDGFVFLKKRKILNQLVLGPRCSTGVSSLDKDIRYSPDTTNFDHLGKTFEPKLTRTIENKVNNQFVNELPNKSQFVEDWTQHVASNSRYRESTVLKNRFEVTARNDFQASGSNIGPYKRRLDSPYRGNLSNKIPRLIHSDYVNVRRNYASMPSNSSSGSDDRYNGPRQRGSPYTARGLRTRGNFRQPNNFQFGMDRRSGQRFFRTTKM